MIKEFDALTFDDPALAEQRLAALLEQPRDGLSAHLAHALAETGDPATTLMRLERYLDAAGEAASAELDRMAGYLHYTRLLCTLLDQSHFLTEILCRNPEYGRWLWEHGDLERTPAYDMVMADIRRETDGTGDLRKRMDSMRRYRRREVLRIAARDVFQHVSVQAVTRDLSNLADAFVAVAYESAWAMLAGRYGIPMVEQEENGGKTAGFVVLAMGKHGGQELNYSSDIDLLFIYLGDGHTTGGTDGKTSNAEFFHKLGEWIIKMISEQTVEGHIFRVDMRLRPHGNYGPLAVTYDSCLHYYEMHGQAWERQALIKARPIAGDLALGESFIERTRPFVYPRYFDDDTLDDILNVKRQMETHVADRGERDTEVKLGRGGIRDIEFTVQMLQLLNGGRIPELRTGSTLEAIRVLGEFNLLSPFEATTLASNYAFLRQVEHRLQIEGSQQRHALPADPKALDLLAKKLGYTSGESYMRAYSDRANETREILERFYAKKGRGTLWVSELLNPHSDGADALENLAELGFVSPQKAREELLRLAHGERGKLHSAHVRQRFLDIAPSLIQALSKSHDPDRALMRLAQLFAELSAPGSIYDILHWYPKLCGWLVLLVSNSEYLTNILTRDPGLFETFGAGGMSLDREVTQADLDADLGSLARAYDPEAAPYRLRDGEMLRVGMRELFDNITILEVGRELTQLAEVILAHAVRRARAEASERFGQVDAAFTVLGLGKLGGREMGYGSDLDLVFVYDGEGPVPEGVDRTEYFTSVASRTIKILSAPTRYGALYEIDSRLRPHGHKGALAVSRATLEDYYTRQAQPWERLALIKVRAVAGDADFGRVVEKSAQDIAFSLPLSAEVLDQIEDIRQRLCESAAALDLKKAEGGLIEVEFAVRLLQLLHAPELPELKRADVLGAIDALATHAMLTPDDFSSLTMAYLLFRRLENRVRMMHGRSGSTLAADEAERADLGKRLRIEGDLAEQVQAHKQRVHATYVQLLERLREN